ncbi:hypothetical protein MMC07_008751 [Pseudocyphellaria aurata]|nr:hypothetical protein [Pseudocyphellaria aurata]
MITNSSAEGVKPPAPVKRSIFNKPSWSNPQPIGDTDDFFHRSNQTYVEIAAEAERKRKRKLARRQREQTRDEPSGGRAGKRMRVSDDSDDDGNSSSSDDDTPQNEKETNSKLPDDVLGSKSRSSNPKETNSRPLEHALDVEPPLFNSTESNAEPKSLGECYEDAMATHKPAIEQTVLRSNIIDLEEDSEDPDVQENFDVDHCQMTTAKFSQSLDEDEFTASDEEFPELARKARDKARRKRLEADIVSTNVGSPSIGGNCESLQQTPSFSQPIPPPEAVIQILITSQIENTNPLIVNRRVSQRLKDVRLAWCQRQGFALEFIPTVFLTWRGKRLFDVTTCKSLGIAVDHYGNILLKGQKDVMGEADRQIHMEAMTDEILEKQKKAKRRVITDEVEENVEAVSAAVTDDSPVEKDKESQVRIILKAKGFEDFKIIVKPSILISKIVNAFRSEKKVGRDKEVLLFFDGDRLNPQTKVEETELSDMDYVDVYVKERA